MAAENISVDVAVVGAGGAGLSLVLALERTARRAGARQPSIAVVDPVHRREQDRTWCCWSAAGHLLDHRVAADLPVHRSWSRMELVDRFSRSQTYDLGARHYQMVRSSDFYAAADEALARLGPSGAVRVTEAVVAVDDGPQHAVVRAGAAVIQARWVFDSRPAAPRRPGSTMLLQHFRGWTVRFDQPLLDPEVATLMDFRVPQPARGVAFGYCLPLDDRRALVEYTEFGRERLSSPAYDVALRGYLRQRWDLQPGRGVAVESVEDGVIGMTDAPFARRVGQRVFRLGSAGGATRPSTGYTFATMQRQADGIAARLLDGRTPMPPRPYPARHRWMDAVLLRALDRGYLNCPDLFTQLFADNPSPRVLRFLDGRSGPLEELALMRSTPTLPMLRAAIEDGAARARRRFAV
jgi:lycopene beta-cyclase